MADDTKHSPRQFDGVMLSSTFTDLKEHREILAKALTAHGLFPISMENDSAKVVDVVESSLKMVRDCAAYVGIIGTKYGQIPPDAKRNPKKVSITELEFDEALRLDRPILMFFMGDKHPVVAADVETNAAKRKKLDAFRTRAKKDKDSSVHRVYATFESLAEFAIKVSQSVAGLQCAPPVAPAPDKTTRDPIPEPPAFYAEPRYPTSHKFVGRRDQLETLSEWALPADQHPVLLFDAIGGSGKSMLTWEWTNKHATVVRSDWAGRFWYSFYERGSIMVDFCRHALHYITRESFDVLNKLKTPELARLLLLELEHRPWLFILDGLERVLVAYHRIDAAEVRDDEVNQLTDKIAQRDPCAAIRPEDDDLVRALATVTPSKILITTRLVPKALLDHGSQPIPGVRRVSLPGLRPADAEALLRSYGVKAGNSEAIQNYLKSNCDCHPLITGVLGGLIANYLPARGDFDKWSADPSAGGKLNLADLDLKQRRNHILEASIDALEPKTRQLLSTLALLSDSANYDTLRALNPHLPTEPEKVYVPDAPRNRPWWSEADTAEAQENYRVAVERRKVYEQEIAAWRRSPEVHAAARELARSVRDLEQRGLLQYDAQSARYDLHPVVRGIAAGGLVSSDRDAYGQRVVDYFSAQHHNPYEDAETLEDVRGGIQIVRTLIKMGNYERACRAFQGDLSRALLINLEANAEVLSVLAPFFPRGWGSLPSVLDEYGGAYLANEASIALEGIGKSVWSLAASGAALDALLRGASWGSVRAALTHIGITLLGQNRLALHDRCCDLALDLATLTASPEDIFRARLERFAEHSRLGRFAEAQGLWELLHPMGRKWSRATYRPGIAESRYAQFRLWQGKLSEPELALAEQLAKAGKNRSTIRDLHWLRGEWLLAQGEWALAADSLREAVGMARAVGQSGAGAEAQLALAQFHLGQLAEPRREAEQLAAAKNVSHLDLADLWLAIDDREEAAKHALAAHKQAWADGEPYVRWYQLTKSRAILEQLGVEIPNLPPYDPDKVGKIPHEDEVVAAIEKLRAEKAAKS